MGCKATATIDPDQQPQLDLILAQLPRPVGTNKGLAPHRAIHWISE